MVDSDSTKEPTVWLITGVSRGLGQALCKVVLNSGNVVIGTTRTGNCDDFKATAGEFHCLAFDATRLDAVPDLVKKASAIKGRLDYVVNNAGYAQLGAIEEVSLEQFNRQFIVNVYAPFLIMQQAVALLKQQSTGGMIINVTSIAGIKASPGSSTYSASKMSMEGLSEGLSQEIASHKQIKVMIVEPGAFHTDFLATDSRFFGEKQMPEYEKLRETYNKRHRNQPGDPAKGMQVVYDIATKQRENPPLRLVLGKDAYQRGIEKAQSLIDNFKQYEQQSCSTDRDGI